MSKKKVTAIGVFLILLIGGILMMNMNKKENKVVQDYPRPIDVVSVKPVITCNVEKEEEINISVQNYTGKSISNFNVDIVSKNDNKKITSLNFEDIIKANEGIDVRGRIPNGLSYDEVTVSIADYDFEK